MLINAAKCFKTISFFLDKKFNNRNIYFFVFVRKKNYINIQEIFQKIKIYLCIYILLC